MTTITARFSDDLIVMSDFKDDGEFFDTTTTLSRLCREHNRWGVYTSWDPDVGIADTFSACPFVFIIDHASFENGYALTLTKTEAQARSIFDAIVGDEGPTKTNPYDGPGNVYALLIRDDGALMTENT